MQKCMDDRSQAYIECLMSNIDREVKGHLVLPHGMHGVILVLSDAAIKNEIQWINELFALNELHVPILSRVEFLQFAAIFFYSQTTNICLTKFIEHLTLLETECLCFTRYLFIWSKLCACSPTMDAD